MYRNSLSVLALALGVAACGGGDEADQTLTGDTAPVAEPMPMETTTPAAGAGAAAAQATLQDAQGQQVGTATFTESGGGVQIEVQLTGLPEGPHGVHVHAVGQCDAPGFTTAGPHFNPTNAQHGLENPQGPHAGDMPQAEVGAGGTGSVSYASTMLSLADGPNSLFDADGSALVVHAAADDQTTDPSGNSGDRIACGVIERGGM